MLDFARREGCDAEKPPSAQIWKNTMKIKVQTSLGQSVVKCLAILVALAFPGGPISTSAVAFCGQKWCACPLCGSSSGGGRLHPSPAAAALNGSRGDGSGGGGHQSAPIVRWYPGRPHDSRPHVVASDTEGVWEPANGYRFVTQASGTGEWNGSLAFAPPNIRT
jgi:hypothetical protein